jgi:AcrR family transcriptional regulator
MTSLRHKSEEPTTADLALDAARESILAVGWSRTTLTEVARRAGVSRMTIYRKWPDMGALLADLMTREWAGLVQVAPRHGTALDQLVAAVVGTVRAVRVNPLFARIIELDPERLLPYLLERPGRSQSLVLSVVVDQVRAGQAAGEIRAGDPHLLARSVVLTCHGFALSAATMTRPGVSVALLDEQLAVLVENYLRP